MSSAMGGKFADGFRNGAIGAAVGQGISEAYDYIQKSAADKAFAEKVLGVTSLEKKPYVFGNWKSYSRGNDVDLWNNFKTLDAALEGGVPFAASITNGIDPGNYEYVPVVKELNS